MDGLQFDLLGKVSAEGSVETMLSWLLRASVPPRRPTVGRVFPIRKTEEASGVPMEGFHSQPQRKGCLVQKRNIESARHLLVVPPCPSPDLAASAVFKRHRLWWQFELACRCLKALNAPVRTPNRAAKRPSSLLYGWLPVALLAEELNRHAGPARFTVPDGTIPMSESVYLDIRLSLHQVK